MMDNILQYMVVRELKLKQQHRLQQRGLRLLQLRYHQGQVLTLNIWLLMVSIIEREL